MDSRSRNVRHSVHQALDAHMAGHHGLIDWATALQLGATKNVVDERLASGVWVPAHRGVYRAAAAPRTREQESLAAVLAGGHDAVASHRSAAWLWGLLSAAPDLPEITVPYARNIKHRGIEVHRSTDILGTALSRRRGIILTPPARTILDVSGVVPPHITDVVIDRAVATKLLTVPALLAALEQLGRRGRRGVGKLRKALEARGVSARGHAPSVLESAMARLIRQTDIAPPIAEYPVAGGRFRLDFAWPDVRYATELQGWASHTAYDDWVRTIDKRNWANEHGWEIAELTWDDVKNHPERTATRLMHDLARRRLDLREL